jgi:hypothetical protein
VATFSRVERNAALDAHNERLLAKILLETGEAAPPATVIQATLAGDSSRLRGLPAIARGVSGAIPGTQPERALLAKERRRL